MHSVANLTLENINVFDNLVPRELYSSLLEISSSLDWQFGWKTLSNPEMRYWHHEVGYGKKDNVDDISSKVNFHPQKIYSLYQTWLLTHVFPPGTKILRYYLNAHTYGTDGWPHTDSERSGEITAVLYLNSEWRAEWAGETVIFDADGDIARTVLPRANRLLTFSSQLLHAPRPLSKVFNDLRIVLVVKAALPVSTARDHEPLPEHIELLTRVGCDELGHSGRDLLTHLIGTYRILRQQSATEAVCLAGLFHSVYGTSFLQCTIAIDRAMVRQLIGEQAERLAWLFCVLDRPACWRSTELLLPLRTGGNVNIQADELTELQQIEQANLIEQGITDVKRWHYIEQSKGMPTYSK